MPGKGWPGESFQVAVLYVGAVIGAGFASGQEILQLFVAYGRQGLFGALLVTALFSLPGFSFMLPAVMYGTAS